MISKVGAEVKVRLYRTDKDRRDRTGFTELHAVPVSDGPPGILGDWARTTSTPPRWLLIRKPSDGMGKHYDAIEGEAESLTTARRSP